MPVQAPLEVRKRAKEAKEGIVFVVERSDVKGSTVADPQNCAGARALCRITGIKQVWVGSTVTYIEFADGRVERFLNSDRVRNTVNGFDHTAGLFPEGEYRLRPPSKTQTRTGYRKAKRERGYKRGKRGSGGQRKTVAIR